MWRWLGSLNTPFGFIWVILQVLWGGAKVAKSHKYSKEGGKRMEYLLAPLMRAAHEAGLNERQLELLTQLQVERGDRPALLDELAQEEANHRFDKRSVSVEVVGKRLTVHVVYMSDNGHERLRMVKTVKLRERSFAEKVKIFLEIAVEDCISLRTELARMTLHCWGAEVVFVDDGGKENYQFFPVGDFGRRPEDLDLEELMEVSSLLPKEGRWRGMHIKRL